MRISARADYAVRAAAELARAGREPLTVQRIAAGARLPPRFLENILVQLRRAGLAESRRGQAGGYVLTRDPAEITLDEVVAAVDGLPRATRSPSPVADLWTEVMGAAEGALAGMTLADVARTPKSGKMGACASPPGLTTPSARPSSSPRRAPTSAR